MAESARAFERQGGGHIVGFSSIAAAAPRRRTTVHAPAKAALEACLRALRHDSAGTPVVVQVYALGYVDTAPTFGKDMGVVDHLRYRWLITRLLRPLPWRGCGRLRF